MEIDADRNPGRRARVLLLIAMVLTAGFARGDSRPGVVYHIDNPEVAVQMIRYISNHLKTPNPPPVTVVAIGHGVDFLVDDAKDKNGNTYAALMAPLMDAGVVFNACQNTLNAFSLTPDDLSMGVETVPSGAAEIARLQLEEGYAYFKP